jgi:hypothetical protein
MDAPDPSSIPLPAHWARNLAAVVAAPLAYLPASALPHPSRRTVEGMRGAGLLAAWDRRGEGLGLYVTLTPWAAECLAAAVARAPGRGLEHRELLERLQELGMEPRKEEPLRWELDTSGRRDGAPVGCVEALALAGYRPPTIALRIGYGSESRSA